MLCYVVADKAVTKKIFRFYRAAWNATRSYDEISVCLSVRPSVRPSVRLSVCLSVCQTHAL